MDSETYLAMTAEEISIISPLPPKTAWMACHFSPYGTGLTNLPPALPPGSLLMLADRVPLAGHDPVRIAAQLEKTVQALDCSGLLLDFQRHGIPEAKALAKYLTSSLPCPVAVSEPYGAELDCPVFLSPCPQHTHLSEHIAPWSGREIWLDLAADAQTLTLTKTGCAVQPLPCGAFAEEGFADEALHCHYRVETGDDFARFTLWRTSADLKSLSREAKKLGVKTLVGLYQELYCPATEKHPSR